MAVNDIINVHTRSGDVPVLIKEQLDANGVPTTINEDVDHMVVAILRDKNPRVKLIEKTFDNDGNPRFTFVERPANIEIHIKKDIQEWLTEPEAPDTSDMFAGGALKVSGNRFVISQDIDIAQIVPVALVQPGNFEQHGSLIYSGTPYIPEPIIMPFSGRVDSNMLCFTFDSEMTFEGALSFLQDNNAAHNAGMGGILFAPTIINGELNIGGFFGEQGPIYECMPVSLDPNVIQGQDQMTPFMTTSYGYQQFRFFNEGDSISRAAVGLSQEFAPATLALAFGGEYDTTFNTLTFFYRLVEDSRDNYIYISKENFLVPTSMEDRADAFMQFFIDEAGLDPVLDTINGNELTLSFPNDQSLYDCGISSTSGGGYSINQASEHQDIESIFGCPIGRWTAITIGTIIS